MFIIFGKMIFSRSDSEYGTRLKGLVKIENSTTKEIINEVKDFSQWSKR